MSSDPPQLLASVTTNPDDALLCPQCGYNLTGLTEDRCPECGMAEPSRTAFSVGTIAQYRAIKRWCLAVIAVLWVGGGVVDGVVTLKEPGEFLISIGTGICAYFWWRADTFLHRDKRSKLRAVLMVLIPGLGVPAYLISRRRWLSLLKAVGFTIGIYAGSVILNALAYRVVHGTWSFV